MSSLLKFVVDRSAFQKALQQIDNIIPAREIRSVVSNFLLQAKDNQLTLSATDLEISIQTTLDAKVETSGSIALPARKLSETVRVFQSRELPFTVDENHTATLVDEINDSRTTISLNGQSSEEFPAIPWPASKDYISVSGSHFIAMMRKTAYAIAEEDARYMFNGLFMHAEGKKLTFVATDGRRLSKVDRTMEKVLQLGKGIIVPGKAIRELMKVIEPDQNCDIHYSASDQRLFFRAGNIQLQTRLIEGNFPDYKQVIPSQVGATATINRQQLENSIRKVAVVAIDASRQIQFDVKKDQLHLRSATPDLGRGDNSLPCQYAGDAMSIAFNSIYIQDILKIIEADEIRIGFTSASSPAIVMDPGDSEFLAVVMPMKLDAA